MISRRALLIAGAQACAFGAAALEIPNAEVDAELRRRRAAWLERHTAPIRSLEFADDDFSDLEPVARAIGDARIVMLGEQTHGDGTTLQAKTRFIRFLHERMGFDVLAFESGLYDLKKGWEQVRTGRKAKTAIGENIYRMWTWSQQVQPLFDYIDTCAASTRPLEVAGFDCKFTGDNGRTLAEELAAFLAANGIEVASIVDWPRLHSRILQMPDFINWGPSEEDRVFITNMMDILGTRIAAVDAPEASFWRQMLKNIKGYIEFRFHMDPWQARADDVRRRDAAMGSNFNWLAGEAFAGRKIIVWAATDHNARNLHLTGDRDPFNQLPTMGHFAWEAFGENIYSVAFSGYAGQTAWAGVKGMDAELVLPPSGSLEDWWGATAQNYGFLDLRNIPAGGEWLLPNRAQRTENMNCFLGNA